MRFSFVLLTWNRCRFLERCLKALLESIAYRDQCEVVVLDNGSTDGTKDLLASYRAEQNFRVITLAKNHGLNAYKRLFKVADAEYVVVVDDDVLEFPAGLDSIFADYLETFPEYGFLALNVVQNEFTNGAKPGADSYVEKVRDGKTIEHGPTGGWCTCFRSRDYGKLWWPLLFTKFDMKNTEDGFLVRQFKRRLGLKSGIIRDAVCFHATGPYYAREFRYLDREIEKYAKSNLPDFVAWYESYRNK